MSHSSSVSRRLSLGHRKCENKSWDALAQERKSKEDKCKIDGLLSVLQRKLIIE